MHRWGIIGGGRVAGRDMVPAIRQAQGHELIAVAGRTGSRAKEFGEAFQVPQTYGKYHDLLRESGVSCVYVSSPNALHVEHAVAAARAGKHVLCEKPLATSVEDAKAITDQCERSGVVLGMNYQRRHFSALRKVKELIAAGTLGEIRILRIEVGAGAYPLRGWRTESGMAGLGAIFNIAIHAYDAVRYVTGSEVWTVCAQTASGDESALETTALALFRLANGTLVYVSADQSIPIPCNDIYVYGTKGSIMGTNVTYANLEGELRLVIEGQSEVRSLHSSVNPFVDVIHDFGRAIEKNTTPLATGLDGLRSVEIALAVAQSAMEGRALNL